MMQTSRILYHFFFLIFYRSEKQKRTDLYGGTVRKRGVALFCFFTAGVQ